MIAIESHCLAMVKTNNSTDGVANFMAFLEVRKKQVLAFNNRPRCNIKNTKRFHK